MVKYSSKYTEGFRKGQGQGERYDKVISNRFESFIWSLERHFLLKIFKKYLKEDKNIRYLDFACGTGRVLGFFDSLVKDKTAVDTSKFMLAEAKKKAKADFIEGNIIEDDSLLKGKRFDMITSFRLFLNLESENRIMLLKELGKYLDEKGILVVNNHMNRFSFLGFQFWLRKNVFGEKLKREAGKGIINTMSECEFRQALKKSGYRIVKVYRFALLPGRKNLILLPESILKPVELFFSSIPLLNLLGKDQIYVCRKAKTG